MSSDNIHVAGRYNKYSRNLSQSPWIDKDDIRIKHSVQELIEDGLNTFLKFDKCVFSSSGREDVDVRMLGRGRPFVFKIIKPLDTDVYKPETLEKIQRFINEKYSGLIQVRDLQIVDKQGVSKHIKDGEQDKTKLYQALCCCSRPLGQDDINRVNGVKDLIIAQKTPIRVLHRRSLFARKRSIHKMTINAANINEFQTKLPAEPEQLFTLTLLTEAGTYIKEFVHGDFGRTQPSLGDIISNCDTDLIDLDVMEVSLDWPPRLSESSISPINIEMNNPDVDISQLFTAARNKLEEAEKLPRGPDRQKCLIASKDLFERASKVAENLSLYSQNETIDDVSTADLKYLSIPAYLAKVITLSECGTDRLKHFSLAESFIVHFLESIARLELADKNVIRNIISNPPKRLGDSTSDTSLQRAMRDRDDRINRYKKTKLLENKLAELEERMAKEQSENDELSREYHLSLLKRLIDDSIECLEREVRPAILFEQNPASPAIIESRPQSSSKSTFTIVKNDIQKQVFGVGYPSRPTVTVDEFISKKLQEGDLVFDKHKQVYANSLQRYAEEPNLRRDQEDLSDEERERKEDAHDEEELKRKRDWDEFKDDNPRGSGNRHNMG